MSAGRRARTRARKRAAAVAAALAAAPPPSVKLAVRVLGLGVEVRHALDDGERRTLCREGIVGAFLERGAPDCPPCLAELARKLLDEGVNP